MHMLFYGMNPFTIFDGRWGKSCRVVITSAIIASINGTQLEMQGADIQTKVEELEES